MGSFFICGASTNGLVGTHLIPAAMDHGMAEVTAASLLAAIGVYHVDPGTAAWELSRPAFQNVTLSLGKRRFVIDAPGAAGSDAHVQQARLNGAPLSRTYLTTCELRHGGKLTLSLSAASGSSWATGAGAAPPSQSTRSSLVDRCASRLARGHGA